MVLCDPVVRIRPETLRPPLRRLLAAVYAVAPDAYLVGGAVRDLLRDAEPIDLDFVTAGDVAAVSERVAAALGGSVFSLDLERGQRRAVLPAESGVQSLDFSPLRGNIESDLRTRDFTIDAMAAPIEADGRLGALIDPCDGARDLDLRLVRMTGEAALRADPLRLLRAVRIAVELDFAIEDETAAAIRALAPTVRESAAERQRDELVRVFATARSTRGLRLLDSLLLLGELVPELMAARGVEQPVVHYYDVFDHSLEAVANLDVMLSPEEPETERPGWLRRIFLEGFAWYPLRDYLDESVGGRSRLVLLKLAGLLHDVSKPETKTTAPDGRVRFFQHPELGALKAASIGERLRLSNRESQFVALLVDEHLRPTQLSSGDLPSARALYRFARDLGDAAAACLILCLADGASAAGPRLTPEVWTRQVAYMSWVLHEAEAKTATVMRAPRLITGDDLITELGIEPGPLVGRLLAALEEAIGAGEVSTREGALALASSLLRAWRDEEAHG